MTQLSLMPVDADTVDLSKRTIRLPFLPPSKNQYEAWPPMWRSGLRKKWYKALEAEYDSYSFPIDAKRVAVAIKLTFASRRARDWQNYTPMLHHVIPDSLVRFGCIPDDTPERYQVGPNGGVVFDVDSRKLDKSLRQYTTISYVFEV